MMLTEKCHSEPAAAQLLLNLIKWLSNFEAATRTAAVIGPPEFTSLLRSLGLHFADCSATPAAGDDWSAHRLVIWRQEPPDLARVREYVQQGGTVWLHRLPWKRIGPVAAALGVPLEARPYAGPVTRVENAGPWLDFITREDLYWLGRHEGIGWDETPRADRMTDTVFSKSLASKTAASYEE